MKRLTLSSKKARASESIHLGNIGNCMNTRKPFVVPALADMLPFRLKAVQQTAKIAWCNFLDSYDVTKSPIATEVSIQLALTQDQRTIAAFAFENST